MSKPVIPERYKLQHSGFVGMLANGSEDGNGFVEMLVIKLMGEVGVAEAEVAKQAATIERLTGYLDYMAMGFVPPDRCKSYAATALKNPSEPA